MNGINNTDNKLRQLENQSLPDLSKQDQHWQDMKKMLQPGAGSIEPSTGMASKLWQWTLAACFIGGIALLVFKQPGKRSSGNEQHPIAKDTSSIQSPVSPVRDGVFELPVKDPQPINNNTALNNTNSLPKRKNKKDHIDKNVVATTTAKTDPIKTLLPDTFQVPLPGKKESKPDELLAGFFKQLEKTDQQFTVNPARDTVITGAEGSSLLIPANTFNTSSPVTIVLKEYFSYEDIITNKLTTTSDGQQLVTGGMIHIKAMSEGREINMQPGKTIQWILRDTTSAMQEMEVFYASANENTGSPAHGPNHDTVAINSSINWRPSSNKFANDFVTTKYKVLDLRDLPFKAVGNRKYKAYFFQNTESGLSKDELRDMLHKKYPDYDKIIIAGKKKKKEWTAALFAWYSLEREVTSYSIGDTCWVNATDVKRYKLSVLDTIAYTSRSSVQKTNPSLNSQLKKIGARYSVGITRMGWINCDKFLQKQPNLVDYVVNIGDDASNYYTFLAFEKIKSMIAGYVSGNKIVFAGIPQGEEAKLISVGIKDGKAVSAMESVKITHGVFNGLKFEETNPAAFREQAAGMDK